MMTLYKYVRDWVEQYTFVTHTTFKKAIFRIYYISNGNQCFKRLSYRTSKAVLEKTIQQIKIEVGFEESKRERDTRVRKEVAEDLIKKPIIEI